MNLKQEKPTGAPRFPDANYRFRITSEPEFQVSKKGNDMYVFNFECLGMVLNNGEVCQTGMVDGAEVEFAGWEFQFWAVFFETDAGEMVNPNLEKLHTACGFPLEIERDETTGLPIGVTYTGAEFFARAKSVEKIATGPDGKPLINPVTNKVVKSQQRQIIEIYC